MRPSLAAILGKLHRRTSGPHQPSADARKPAVDLDRRGLLAAGVVGAGSALLLRAEPLGGGRSHSPSLIRPPGAAPEPEFLEKCVRCGECMKVCPTNAIQPALGQGGIGALWTPFLDMDVGYCEYECTLCSQVCPTGAIRALSVEEKQKIRIGLAHFDRNRCLPYAYGRSCIVCEEHCPLPRKAIRFQDVEVVAPSGERVTLKQPLVDPESCTGCGICQNKCPMADRAAVLVTSVGESRSRENQILLGAADPYGT